MFPPRFVHALAITLILGGFGVPPALAMANDSPPRTPDKPAITAPPAEQLEDEKTIDDFLGKVSLKNGHLVSRQCMLCHTFDEGGPDRAGSNLFGIIGARMAHVEGFNYSKVLKARHDEIWTIKKLNLWLLNPHSFMPGTRMVFGGVNDDRDRKDLIAYIRSQK